MALEWVAWAWGALVLPVLGWIGLVLRRRRARAENRRQIVRTLCGLPTEAKALLCQAHYQRTYYLRLMPHLPVVQILEFEQVLTPVTQGVGDDGLEADYAIRPQVREVMDDWIAAEYALSQSSQVSR